MRYRVLCQDAVGHKTEVTVHADTDERACNAALRTLNSWRAVRALPHPLVPSVVAPPIPSVVERAVEPDHEIEQAVEPEDQGRWEQVTLGRIVHRPSVGELVREHRGGLGSLGRALKKACE